MALSGLVFSLVTPALLVGLDWKILGNTNIKEIIFLSGPSRPDFVKSAVDKFHYLHFGAFSFLLSSCVGVLVSLLTPPIQQDKLYRLTFWTR